MYDVIMYLFVETVCVAKNNFLAKSISKTSKVSRKRSQHHAILHDLKSKILPCAEQHLGPRSTCSEPGSDFADFDLTYFLHLKNPGYTSPMISSSKTIPSMEGEDDVSGLAVDGQPSCAPHLPRQVRSHPVLLLLSPTTTAF